MVKPDFDKYTLALIREDEIIFSSKGTGLRPLVDCLAKYGQEKNKLVLHDKVTGLAAARLAVYSGIISAVHTRIASRPAQNFLEDNNLELHAGEIAPNILTKDRQAICPGEVLALNTVDPSEFAKRIKDMLGNNLIPGFTARDRR
jgi:hypothetical protein